MRAHIQQTWLQMLRACCLSLAIGLLLALVAGDGASAQTPASVRVLRGTLVTPSAAATYYGGATTSTNGLCQTFPTNTAICTSNRAPEIVELARSLRNDPDLIYEYVRNRIDTEFMFGLHKGGLGAIIDGSGTAFDQAQLMVELLRQAGFTANYQYGTISLNGAQFLAWTGISDARAACDFLASGAIPATVNGGASCAAGAISNVTLQHIWVQANIGGTNYLFDPAFKDYRHYAGIDVRTVMGVTPGSTLSTATTGMTSGTQSTLNYISTLNQAGVGTSLNTWSSAMLTRLQQSDLQGAALREVIGGREIIAAVRPAGGWRQTSLPYVSGSPASWSGGVPNQYRATLRVVGAAGAVTPFDVTFYSDEIAGRNLGFRALRTTEPRPPGANNWDRWAYTPQLFLDDVALVSGTSARVVGPIGLDLDLTLTIDHPYTSGSGIGTDGAFTVAKRVNYLMPSLVLVSWGATSPDLAAQWDREQGRDEAALIPINPVRSNPDPSQSPDGKGARMRIAATWLAQFSRASEIHGELANARVTQHHNVGIVSAFMQVSLTPVPDGSAPAPWNYSFQDERTLIDIESGYSVTTRNNDATARRAAAHAIAATGSSLEGGVVEQLESAPDAASAVRRLTWGNAPESGETPNTTSRRVFAVNASNAAQMTNVMVYENQASGNIPPFNNQEGIDAGFTTGPKAAVASAVSDYAIAGFDVVASNEARLGPGSRMGAVYLWSYSGTTPVYRRGPSNQVGGAFIANRYDVNGDPIEIAFVNTSGSQRLKGGGGPSVTQQAEYDPHAAAEVLQGRFQERPPILGVNLTTGSAGFTSPVLQSRGQGAFPYRIEQRLELRGGGLRRLPLGPADVVPVADQDGMVTNWDGAALPSSSGLAAMGQSRAEPAAQTIAAFVAMQDVWRASPSTQREMAGVIAADWWRQSMSFNVATVMQGGQSEEYVRLNNGTFVPSEGGAASFSATGARTPVRPTTQNFCPFNNCTRQYAPTRRWDDHLLQLSARSPNGDVRAYQYWGPTTFGAGTGSQQAGFRLNTWTFPQGVTLTLAYNATESGAPLFELPTGVSTNFGQTLTWTRPTEVTNCSTSPSIIATDLASAQTRARFRNLVARTVSQRPSGTCDLIELFEPVDTVTPAIRYTYDSANRISEAFDAVAIRTPASRGPYRFNIAQGYRGESVNPILPVGGAYAVETLESGRLRRYIDELGRITTANMDGRGRLLQRIYPEGDMDLFAYDARDNVIEFRRRAKPTATPALADIVVSATWNATWNKPDTITDARGYVTNFAYGAAGAATGQVVTATRPNPNIAAPGTSGTRPIYTYTYGNFGRLATSTDPTGLVVSNTYNATTGYLESSTLDPTGLNATTLFVNNALGDVTATTDPRGNVVETTYDAMRRPRDVLHHNGNVAAPLLAAERTNYDLMGRVLTTQGGTAFSGTTVTTWLTRETRTYTPTGQVWTIADALSNTTTNAYDRADRLETVTDPVSRETRNEYDAAGQLLRIRRAVGTPIEQEYAVYAYTPNGQRDWVEDANDNRSDYVYDGFDRLCRLFFPVTTVGAHAANAPAPTPPTNQLQCDTPTNVGNDYEQYGYDPNSNRTSLRVRSGETIGYTYDGLNRETVRDIPGGTSADVYTSYDLAGRRLSARFVSTGGQGIVYAYDTAGRLQSETSFGRALTFLYDAASNRERISWSDGFYAQYTFDAMNRVDLIRENGSTTLADYAYDALSRRATITRGDGSVTTYGYDNSSRLTSLTQSLPGTVNDQTFGFGYTNASQISQRTTTNDAYAWPAGPLNEAYTRNGLNQYTNVGARAFTHDVRGNLQQNQINQFQYDLENRLTAVNASAGSPTLLNIAYDPLGRLRSTSVPAGASVDFLYDGDALAAEYNSGGALLRRYVFGPGIDDPVVWYEGSTTSDRRYLIADNQVSIIATSGATTVRYRYGPYGETDSWSGSRFRYTGQIILHPDLSTATPIALYHYKARVYDPGLGRFLQTDPVGYDDDFNLYMFVHNDPLNYIDPTGTQTSVIVVNQSPVWPGGAHAALYVHPRPGRPGVLFDPGGDFTPSDEPVRPSSAYYDEDAGQNFLREFVEFETRGGRSVTVTTVMTDRETEDGILAGTGGLDGPDGLGDPGPGNCAQACSTALSGEGPFDEGTTFAPGNLRERAEDAAATAGGFQDRYQRNEQGRVEGQRVRTWRGTSTGTRIRR